MGKWVESNKTSGVDGSPTTLRSDYVPGSGLLRSGRNVENPLTPNAQRPRDAIIQNLQPLDVHDGKAG